MSRKLPRNLLARITKTKNQIAKDRDQLRDLFEEVEAILGSTEDAVESLEYSIDRLSEYV